MPGLCVLGLQSRCCNLLLSALNDKLFITTQNDRTRNNGAKLIVKRFNTSVAAHFYPIKITTTWNALPNEVLNRTVNSFKNNLDKHQAGNPSNARVNWQQLSMPCTIQVCTNSRRPEFCWKLTQRSVLLNPSKYCRTIIS